MVDPEHIPSFVEWRDQSATDLSVWYFMSRGLQLNLDTLAVAATLFAPSFVERGRCVLLTANSDEADFETWWQLSKGDSQAVEAQLNHVHLPDLLRVAASDVRLLAEVADAIASSWRLALRAAFPSRRFQVDVVSVEDDPSGPIVSFWQS